MWNLIFIAKLFLLEILQIMVIIFKGKASLSRLKGLCCSSAVVQSNL